MISQLVKLATKLDADGFTKEAAALDSAIEKMAKDRVSVTEEVPLITDRSPNVGQPTSEAEVAFDHPPIKIISDEDRKALQDENAVAMLDAISKLEFLTRAGPEAIERYKSKIPGGSIMLDRNSTERSLSQQLNDMTSLMPAWFWTRSDLRGPGWKKFVEMTTFPHFSENAPGNSGGPNQPAEQGTNPADDLWSAATMYEPNAVKRGGW